MDNMKQVLNYEDVVLYDRDVKLFMAPNWLNDACVHFAFKIFEEEVAKERCDSVLLMDPAVYNFMMLQSDDPEEADELGQALAIASKEIICVPISDAAGSMAAHFRGSHWSLLAYHRASQSFEHYDSMPGNQHAHHAAKAAQALGALLGIKGPKITRIRIPSQSNGYDCGAHLLVVARTILHHTFGHTKEVLAIEATPQAAANLRLEFFDLATSLANDWCAANNTNSMSNSFSSAADDHNKIDKRGEEAC
mmetsp:Transcript_7827/g.11872  ORF Transcript_7827/g.11872 Transcript_7827/m.11872 type:complete len:250 (-) Transcript_7827:24-773(-)